MLQVLLVGTTCITHVSIVGWNMEAYCRLCYLMFMNIYFYSRRFKLDLTIKQRFQKSWVQIIKKVSEVNL